MHASYVITHAPHTTPFILSHMRVLTLSLFALTHPPPRSPAHGTSRGDACQHMHSSTTLLRALMHMLASDYTTWYCIANNLPRDRQREREREREREERKAAVVGNNVHNFHPHIRTASEIRFIEVAIQVYFYSLQPAKYPKMSPSPTLIIRPPSSSSSSSSSFLSLPAASS